MRRLALIAATLTGLVAAEAAVANSAPPRRLQAMPAETFAAKAVVHDDPLEFTGIISTEPVFRGGKAERGTVRSDAHLRALVDKRTGAVRYEVRKDIRYFGLRRAYETVQFHDGAALRQTALLTAQHGEDQCPNSDFNGVCAKTKTLAFELDEALLRKIAAGDAPWLFRFKEQSGADLTSGIVPAEAAGLLMATENYRRQLAARAKS